MAKHTLKSDTMTGEELGQKLLQSVKEMKAGKAARATQVVPGIEIVFRHPEVITENLQHRNSVAEGVKMWLTPGAGNRRRGVATVKKQ